LSAWSLATRTRGAADHVPGADRAGNGIAGRQGDGEGEAAALAGFAGNRQFAAHQADELARNGQAQAGALVLNQTKVRLIESREDLFLLFLGDAGAGIAHFEAHASVTLGLGTQADATVIGVFDRIAQQVGQHLAQMVCVPQYVARQAGRAVDDETRSLGLRPNVQRLLDASQRRREIEDVLGHLRPARLNARDFQDIVDQRQQMVAGTVDCVAGSGCDRRY